MTTLVALDSEKHKLLKVIEDKNYTHAKEKHLLPIAIHEFALAATNFPIVFVKDSQTGQFKSCVLTGIKPQENLFCKNEQWHGTYIPECLIHYPFTAVSVDEASDRFVICVDEISPLIDLKDGKALFEGNQASDWLTRRGEAAVAWAQKNVITDVFIKKIVDLKLIQPQSLSIKNNGKPYDLTGCYVLNEELLNKLNTTQFMALKENGYLSIIYAALLSLNQVRNLIKLAE
jgi:hypothetical protein